MSYWDTSALVKLYVAEADSPLLLQAAEDSATPLLTSALAIYEAQTTFLRKESEKLLPPGGAGFLHNELLSDIRSGEIRIIEISSAIDKRYSEILERCFRSSPPLLIRSSDAIHLASALTSGETGIYVTDKRMREVAVFLGLTVVPK